MLVKAWLKNGNIAIHLPSQSDKGELRTESGFENVIVFHFINAQKQKVIDFTMKNCFDLKQVRFDLTRESP